MAPKRLATAISPRTATLSGSLQSPELEGMIRKLAFSPVRPQDIFTSVECLGWYFNRTHNTQNLFFLNNEPEICVPQKLPIPSTGTRANAPMRGRAPFAPPREDRDYSRRYIHISPRGKSRTARSCS